MMKSLTSVLSVFVLNIALSGISLAGDASPGMAARGIIRLPQSGMVSQTFGAPRMPDLGTLRKPYKTPTKRGVKQKDISTTSKTRQPHHNQHR